MATFGKIGALDMVAERNTILTLLWLTLITLSTICYGQALNLDSCGLDTSARLNKFEIVYFNNVMFNDSIYYWRKRFDFNDKNIAFFTCDGAQSDDGFVTKDVFFRIIKPDGYRGPKGIFILNEKQKNDAGGIDAIVMIQCKTYSNTELIKKLEQRKDKNMLIPAQK